MSTVIVVIVSCLILGPLVCAVGYAVFLMVIILRSMNGMSRPKQLLVSGLGIFAMLLPRNLVPAAIQVSLRRFLFVFIFASTYSIFLGFFFSVFSG